MCHTDLYLLSACGQMRLWTLLTPHFSVCRLFAAFTVIFRCATVTAHVSRDSDCHFELVNFHFFNKRVHDCAIFGVHLHFEAQIKLSFCIATHFGVFFFFFVATKLLSFTFFAFLLLFRHKVRMFVAIITAHLRISYK